MHACSLRCRAFEWGLKYRWMTGCIQTKRERWWVMIFCKVRRITADTDGHQTSPDFVSLKGQAVIIFCVTVHACGNAVEKSCYFTFTSNCAILIQVVFVRVWFYKSWACKYRQTSQDGTFCCFNKPWNRNRRMNLGGFGYGGPKGPGSSNEAFLSLLNSY